MAAKGAPLNSTGVIAPGGAVCHRASSAGRQVIGSIRHTAKSLLAALREEIFPARCVVCEAELRPGATNGPDDADVPFESGASGAYPERVPGWAADLLCSQCSIFHRHPSLPDPSSTNPSWLATAFRREVLCRSCAEPLHPYEEERRFCVSCETAPLVTGSTVSLWWYCGCVEELIQALKYGGRFDIARRLAEALAVRAADIMRAFIEARPAAGTSRPLWDLVVPVPSGEASLRSRGYHHTRVIAGRFARQAGSNIAPFLVSARGRRSPQASLPASKRRKNVRGAFGLSQPGAAAGRRVLIIDDVLTSGSTAREICDVLTADGACSVDLLTLARARRFREYRTITILGRPAGAGAARESRVITLGEA